MRKITCTRESCNVSVEGKCLEGFDPVDSCPYISKESDLSSETPSGSEEIDSFINLPDGNVLSEEDASILAKSVLLNLVIVAGPPGSGKTTILTSLFEAFQRAPVADFMFAGSKTLIGFENRCFHARVESGLKVADTKHTRVEDRFEFLHLKISQQNGSEISRQDLVLSDVSGELFQQVTDYSLQPSHFSVIQRANNLTIVIDGARILDVANRQSVQTQTRVLLRSLIESNSLNKDCRIQIVFSKWDLVADSEKSAPFTSYVANLRQMIIDLIGNKHQLIFLEIAARPENRKVHFAHGLPKLLRLWTTHLVDDMLDSLEVPIDSSDLRGIARLTVETVQRLSTHE